MATISGTRKEMLKVHVHKTNAKTNTQKNSDVKIIKSK